VPPLAKSFDGSGILASYFASFRESFGIVWPMIQRFFRGSFGRAKSGWFARSARNTTARPVRL